MFIIKQWQSHHFILHAAQKVNEEVQLAMQSMKTASAEGQGLALLHKVWDIDSISDVSFHAKAGHDYRIVNHSG